MHYTRNRPLRASDLPLVVASDSKTRKTVQRLVQIYVFGLMLRGFPKTLTSIATHLGVTICSLSRMLANVVLGEELEIALNRTVRQAIVAYLNRNRVSSVDIIIDATVLERSSRKAENVSLYHANGKKVWGHRMTNVGLLLDGAFYVPLASLAHRSRSYARSCGLSYLTEGMMVRHWLRANMSGLTALLEKMSVEREQITFLLDAGYDNAKIQKAIVSMGCHFLMMIKSSRLVGGRKVQDFFRRNRCIAWENVRLNKTVNGKNKRRKFRTRMAINKMLAGVGRVNVVCSEKSRGRGNIKTRRFLVTSRLSLSARSILEQYARRWTIETWHKDMKQNYGLGDCSATDFVSVENHLTLCLIAYVFHLHEYAALPAKGCSLEQYLQFSIRKSARHSLTLINGADKFSTEILERKEQVYRHAA